MNKYSYQLFLHNQNSHLLQYEYVVSLTEEEESEPHLKLTQDRENIRNGLQQKIAHFIDEQQLEAIIKNWAQDIREGYRDTNLILELTAFLTPDSEVISASLKNSNQIPLNLITPQINNLKPTKGALPPLDF